MTDEMMSLRALLEKSPDTDVDFPLCGRHSGPMI